MPRGGRHHGQHDCRIEEADLAAPPDIGVVAAVVDVVEAEQVGEEAAVEFRRFQQAGNVFVAAGLEDIVERRFRVPPSPGYAALSAPS